MRTTKRESLVNEFRRADLAPVSNVRCLNEGIDVPAVDLVAFIDPKRSMIDIVQAIGRALRKPPESAKTHGYILLPVYVDANTGPGVGEALVGLEFHDVWYVLRALMAQDLQLTETVEKLRISQLRGRGDRSDEALSGFLEVIGSAEVERILRSSIKVQVIEELGEFARCYARDPQSYIEIDDMEGKVRDFLARRFG